MRQRPPMCPRVLRYAQTCARDASRMILGTQGESSCLGRGFTHGLPVWLGKGRSRFYHDPPRRRGYEVTRTHFATDGTPLALSTNSM